MPQIDKVTFFIIVFWIFLVYTLQYLILNATYLYIFFSTIKLNIRRKLSIYFITYISLRKIRLILTFPWL